MFKVCHHKCTTSDVIKKVNNLLAGRKDHAGFQEKFQPFAQADRGPGVSYDVQSERIHERLAHAHQKVLGEDNYRGEIDPRELPLVIAGLNAGPPLLVDGAQSLRILDIAVRGRRPFPGLLISASAGWEDRCRASDGTGT